MSKEKNKGLLILVIVFSVVMVGISSYLVYDKVLKTDENKVNNTNKEENNNVVDNDNDEESNENNNLETLTNYKYEKDKTNNEIVFYKLDENNEYKEINKYKCQYDYCETHYNIDLTYMDQENGKCFVYDGLEEKVYKFKKLMLYDFNKGIIKEFNNAYPKWINGDIDNAYIAILGSDNYNGKNVIIDTEGNIVKEFTTSISHAKDKDGSTINQSTVEDDLMVTSIDGKYGIERFFSNEIIVEHDEEFQNIEIYDSVYEIAEDNSYRSKKLYLYDYCKVQINGKWYLYNIKEKKLVTNGYESLRFIDENIILVFEDNYVYIKDFAGNNVINEKIEIKKEYFDDVFTTSIKIKNNIMTIESFENNDRVIYEYNLTNKDFNKTIESTSDIN